MSRRSKAQRILAEPDPIYNSRLVTLLISRILQSGKKSLAQKIQQCIVGFKSPSSALLTHLKSLIYYPDLVQSFVLWSLHLLTSG